MIDRDPLLGQIAENSQEEVICVDPLDVARAAVVELVMAANSGVFDHERVADLRRKMNAIDHGDDEFLVMRLPRDLN